MSSRSSLLLKQTAFVALVTIVTGGSLILAAGTFARRIMREEIDQRLVLAASDRQTLLQLYVRQQLERVALVASRTRLRQLVAEHMAGKIPLGEFRPQSKQILVDAQHSAEGFMAIAIANPQGIVITTTDETILGNDYGANPDFLEGRQDRHLGVPRRTGETYQSLLTAPIRSDDGNLQGVVIVVLDDRPMVDFLASRTGLGESGEILVGTLQGSQIHLILPTHHNQQLTDLPLGSMPIMESAIRGLTGLMRTRDYRDAEVLAAYRPVSYRDWGLVAKLDVSEAYAPVARLRVLVTVLEAGLLLLGLVLSYMLARRSTRPILELADTAGAIAAGDLNARVAVRSSDEIGVLAQAFNQMTERLASSYGTLEQRVLERTAQLNAANSELEAFSYSVSHDLRAPLRGIDGFSRALLEDYPDRLDAQGVDYLHRIRAAARRMGELIDDLLRLSRLTRAEMRREPVDLSALATATAATLQQRHPERQVTFRIADGLVARGDPHLLRLVLENMLDNAWKFTSKHPHAAIEFGLTHLDGQPVYFVRDDGAGFDMAYADKLFGAFQRLHPAAEFVGTGIGLATVQRIIHRHGGRVWAEGAVEKGATFYFALPDTADAAEGV